MPRTHPKDTTFSLALWAGDVTRPAKSPDAWCARIVGLLEKAGDAGCSMLMLHEYISAHWVAHAPRRLSGVRAYAWHADLARAMMPVLQEAVHATGVALLAGSVPWRDGRGGLVNRACVLFPDRAPVVHDKLALIPGEKVPAGGKIRPGGVLRVFKWRGLRMAVLICLDVEMPALSRLLAMQDIDLLLVPSYTEKEAGYHRVNNCARARAVEIMSAVAVAGCSGRLELDGQEVLSPFGGAAVYVPCEERFGHDGVFAALPCAAARPGTGKLLLAQDIPVGAIRAARHGKAEVWPGPWDAKGVRVTSE